MSNSAPPITSVPIATTPGRSRHTRWFLAAFYLLALMWGVRGVHHAEPSRLDLLFPIAFNLCSGSWAIDDARQRRRPIPALSRAWFVLLAGLLVPGYVIWSRGWRGAGWVILHGVLWYASATIALLVAGVAMYGVGWLRAFGS